MCNQQLANARKKFMNRIERATELRQEGKIEEALNELLGVVPVEDTLRGLFRDVGFYAFRELAHVFIVMDDYEGAKSAILKALEFSLVMEISDTEGTWDLHATLKTVLLHVDGPEAYLDFMKGYLERTRDNKSVDFTARIQSMAEMAFIFMEREEYRQAAEILQQALKDFDRGVRKRDCRFELSSHFPIHKQHAWENELVFRLFRAHHEAGNVSAAEECLHKLEDFAIDYRTLGPQPCYRTVLHYGSFCLEQGRFHDALDYALLSARIAHYVGEDEKLCAGAFIQAVLSKTPMN